MDIYVHAQHCAMGGRIVVDPYKWITIGEDGEPTVSDDIFLYDSGSREEIIERALGSLATRFDVRTAGSGDQFRWTCDRSALDFLNGPDVEYSAEKRCYFPKPTIRE